MGRRAKYFDWSTLLDTGEMVSLEFSFPGPGEVNHAEKAARSAYAWAYNHTAVARTKIQVVNRPDDAPLQRLHVQIRLVDQGFEPVLEQSAPQTIMVCRACGCEYVRARCPRCGDFTCVSCHEPLELIDESRAAPEPATPMPAATADSASPA